jgi:hypothetical protein
LIPANQATIATNVSLSSGDIEPLYLPLLKNDPLRNCPGLKTIHKLNDIWLSWCNDVDVIQGFVPGDTTYRFYYTGDGLPKVSNYNLAVSSPPYPAASFVLGVSTPTTAPTITLVSPGPGVSRSVTYVYTYVSAFGEESGPSPPSVILTTTDGAAVTISAMLPAAAPHNENLNRMRIYRAITGSSYTEFLFVKEVPYFTSSTSESVADAALGESLITLDWEPPPQGLSGLNISPNGFASGFVGNQVFYSEPYQPHTYPTKYKKIFDYPVVACKWFGNTQVVTTTGYTYLVSGVDPRSLTVVRLPDPYPNVSKRSMVSADSGVMYASQAGLVRVGANGLEVITRDVLTEKEWSPYNPSTILGAVYDGKYYGFYAFDPSVGTSGAGFVFDFNDRATGVDQEDKFTDLSEFCTAIFSAPGINMHIVKTDVTLYEWMKDLTAWYTFKWRSKEFDIPYLCDFGAARVVSQYQCEPLTGRSLIFRLYAKCRLIYERVVDHTRPFRLPRFYEEIPFQIEVEGNVAVKQIQIATSIEELKEGGNGAS